MRQSLSFLAAFALVGGLAGAAYAADPATQCHDASGKVVACKCHDASGKYVKCGTPGAMPEKSAQSATGNASNTAAKTTHGKSTTSKSTTNTMGAQPPATSPK